MFIKLGDEHVQQQCSNEICLKFIDAPRFFSLTIMFSLWQAIICNRERYFPVLGLLHNASSMNCAHPCLLPHSKFPNVIFPYQTFVMIIKGIPKHLKCLCCLLKPTTVYSNIHGTLKISTSANFACSK